MQAAVMTEQIKVDDQTLWLAPVVLISGVASLAGALQGLHFWSATDWSPLPVSLLMWLALLVIGAGLGLWGQGSGQGLLMQLWRSVQNHHAGPVLALGLASYLALAFCLSVFATQPGHLATGLLACAAAALIMFAREQVSRFTS